MAEHVEGELVEEEPQSEVEAGANGAAAGAADPNADPEARYRYDEALLIKGKGGKVRRPAKPDEAERNLAIDKLKAEIEKRSARIKEIKEAQEAWRSARAAGQQGNQEIMRRLQGLKAEFQTVLRQKQHIREELQLASKEKEELRTASRAVKDRLPKGVTAETLDVKIRELEHKQQHEGCSGEEEKAILKRLSELNAAKPQYRELAETEARLKVVENKRAEIQHRLQQCDAVLTDVKAREEAERQVLEQSRSRQADGDLDHPALNVEKEESWDIIMALRAKMDEIRKEFNEKYQEYIKLDKNYNSYMRSVKRKEYEERQKARAEREAAENGTADAEAGPAASARGAADTSVAEAYASEVLMLDQLITHLRKLLPADDKAVAQEQQQEVEVPKGMKLLKKDDDVGFMTVAKKKPQQGKKGGGSAALAAEASSKAPELPRSKKLNHSLETLKTFMQFSMEVPQTTAELASTIDKALAKKEYYLELRRTGKKHMPAVPPAAATASLSSGAGESVAVEEATPEPAKEQSAKEQPAQAPEVVVVEAAEPTVAVVAAAATDHNADASKAKSSGLGVALQVDELTELVSIKLSVGKE